MKMVKKTLIRWGSLSEIDEIVEAAVNKESAKRGKDINILSLTLIPVPYHKTYTKTDEDYNTKEEIESWIVAYMLYEV